MSKEKFRPTSVHIAPNSPKEEVLNAINWLLEPDGIKITLTVVDAVEGSHPAYWEVKYDE